MSIETPKRWSELPPGGEGVDARAAALARAARAAPPPLSAEALAALEPRIAAPPARRLAWWKPAGLAALLAVTLSAWLLSQRSEPPPLPPPAVPQRQVEVPAPEPEPLAELAPVEPPPPPKAPPAQRRVASAAQAPAPAPVAEESSLLVETRMLRAALEELRQKHDAAAAGRALDAYFARFPHGALEKEALVARVDVLQALGRRDDALATLNTLDAAGFGNVPRALELRVLRAELLSARDRCAEAVPAFEKCLNEAALPAALDERALVGRASCRARLGDSAGSRADLERYLERYPQGRFAAQARAAIGK